MNVDKCDTIPSEIILALPMPNNSGKAIKNAYFKQPRFDEIRSREKCQTPFLLMCKAMGASVIAGLNYLLCSVMAQTFAVDLFMRKKV